MKSHIHHSSFLVIHIFFLYCKNKNWSWQILYAVFDVLLRYKKHFFRYFLLLLHESKNLSLILEKGNLKGKRMKEKIESSWNLFTDQKPSVFFCFFLFFAKPRFCWFFVAHQKLTNRIEPMLHKTNCQQVFCSVMRKNVFYCFVNMQLSVDQKRILFLEEMRFPNQRLEWWRVCQNLTLLASW